MAKKLAGLLLLIFGLLLLAMGFNSKSFGLTLLGVAALAGGAVLLAWKVHRRNVAASMSAERTADPEP